MLLPDEVMKETKLTSKTVFEGRVIQVRVDSVRLANGREAVREVADHAPAVVIAPIDSDGSVVLVRQYRYPVEEALLEAPAGIVEPGEEPDDCAQRELQEETGYRADDMRPLAGFWTSPGFCSEYMYAYVARDLVPSKLEADYDEDIAVERVPLSEVPEMIRDGRIRDAKTIAVLLMAAHVDDNSNR